MFEELSKSQMDLADHQGEAQGSVTTHSHSGAAGVAAVGTLAVTAAGTEHAAGAGSTVAAPNSGLGGRAYWRSLDELEQTPEFLEFLHREFPVAASEFPEGFSRRRWIQLMGASFGLAGIAGCRWEKEIIAPFVARPANRVPGVPQKFASSFEYGGALRPLVVTCYDGRPIKLEGNPGHSQSLGGTDALTQAMLLHLYDPDRSQQVVTGPSGQGSSWEEFNSTAGKWLDAAAANGGESLRILSDTSTSLNRVRLQAAFAAKFPKAKWVEYESLSRDNEWLGTELTFGQRLTPVYRVAQATVLVLVDSDLFSTHPQSVAAIREWANRRAPESASAEKPMNRLYAIESQFSPIGIAADHRLPMKSSDIGDFLARLETAIDSRLKTESTPPDAKEYSARLIAAAADDLVQHQGAGLVVVGPTQPAEVQARAHRINAKLQNIGKTVEYFADRSGSRPTHIVGLSSLVAEMQNGQVETLLILGANPVYTAPGDLQFATALKKVKQTVHLGDYTDETAELCQWHLPRSHQFESWDVGLAGDGQLTIRQPLIDPIFSTKSEAELIATLLGEAEVTGEAITRKTVAPRFPGTDGDRSWKQLLHDGYLSTELAARVTPTVKPDLDLPLPPSSPANELEVVFTTGHVYDGRFANNGWLQETPDPLSRLTWDNAAYLAPRTADQLGVKTGDLITVKLAGQSVKIAAYVLPGQAIGSIGIALGYGRERAGQVAGHKSLRGQSIPTVGVNVAAIRSSRQPMFATGAEVSRAGGKYPLAMTQDHHAIDKLGMEAIAGRLGDLVREGTLAEYNAHPDFAQHKVHHPPLESLWPERSREGRAWGMAIDLSKCIGCNACMVACQSENNVPIVGKEQVIKGREMHWIRVDRYFAGDVDNPDAVAQPVTCQQCENAPCEQVCPVAATAHSPEGLNDMAYNRCIGTRYCANNCPYKVRRFNFFDNNKRLTSPQLTPANQELIQLSVNPEVTVRVRGVMEKCTFCVQRIQNGKIRAKNEWDVRERVDGVVQIEDGEIQTACQQACPAGAIEFGDLLHSGSKVAAAHENPRSYGLLSELNVKARNKYLARIRNPHPWIEPPTEHAGHGDHHA